MYASPLPLTFTALMRCMCAHTHAGIQAGTNTPTHAHTHTNMGNTLAPGHTDAYTTTGAHTPTLRLHTLPHPHSTHRPSTSGGRSCAASAALMPAISPCAAASSYLNTALPL